MFGYLIDPEMEQITTIDYNGDYKEITNIMKAPSGLFCVVPLYDDDRVDVFLDDEGLYVQDQYFWMHRNYPQPLCGCGLVLGLDDEGDSVSPDVQLVDLSFDVRFIGDRATMQLFMKLYGDREDYRDILFPPIEKGVA